METDNPYLIKNKFGFYVLKESPKPPIAPISITNFNINNIDGEILRKLVDLHNQNKVFEIAQNISVYVYEKDEYEKYKKLREDFYLENNKYYKAQILLKKLNEEIGMPECFSKEFIKLKEKIEELEHELEFYKSEK